MTVEKAVYVDWKDNQVTKEFKQVISQAIEAVVGKLITDRDLDLAQTNYYRGWVRGMVDCLEWEPDFDKEEQDD
jgi:hypothetical protein